MVSRKFEYRLYQLDGLGLFFFLMIRRPPRSTQSRSSAASDVYKRQLLKQSASLRADLLAEAGGDELLNLELPSVDVVDLSLIHISEPTRPY